MRQPALGLASTWPLGAAAAVRSEQALADSSLLALNTALDVNVALLVDSLAGLRSAVVRSHPHLGRIDYVATNVWQPLELRAPGRADFRPPFKDFYLTNPIARASSVMAELSAMASERAKTLLAAE